ncbi:hypothetical protein P168DRAFT_311028 [Aspergillus campestris IBT 28561]|uniref:Uncharacterized protein n=1 Tax=Aspergillus campestris (strain IBT 28561) TaxID=1392248 RepID=A0A2I1D3N6_ASPC2|nr:uncharacterized protein P168DRAFT_311028 [Aspergillus campestris IBT 28561]PKY04479.1 hypothetical protein P168DRAFT_311028 [Aspergillus campestris IBT 28561]
MDGPPPPPPPHGEKPNTTHGEYRKASDLPKGNYDIFIIPPHSSGSGFLYLPSLQCQRNSFIAGSLSTLFVVLLWVNLAPFLRSWYTVTVTSGGGIGFALILAVCVGIAGWAFGASQTAGPRSSRFGFGPGSGGAGAGAGAGPAPNPSGASSGANDGGTHGGPHGNYGSNQGNFGGPPPGNQYAGNQHNAGAPPPQPPPPNFDSKPNSTGPPPDKESRPQSGDDWERAREETRRKEELRRKMEEFKRKREAEAREKQKQREREAMEREMRERREQFEKEMAAAKEAATREAQREAAEARARIEREAAEARAKAQREAAEAQAKAERDAAEARAKAEKEVAEARKRDERAAAELKAKREQEAAEAKARAEKQAAEKEAAAKAAAKKEADAKFAALKEAAAKKYAEKKARDAQEAAAKEATTKAPSQASTPTPTPRTPSPKKSAPTTAPADDASSFRPYDRPRRPYGGTSASSAYSESSYAASQSTARTSPAPSVRRAYETKDPDKIVIKGVYVFNNAFLRTPVAQLVSGEGMVTDGLVLRITTEGLFIDDDIRGVPQREWDVKAWTMKLVEVWCPQFAKTKPAGPKPSNSFFRRAPGEPTAEESDAFLVSLLKVCKNTCRLASPGCFNRTSGLSAAELASLHVLRATIRDQEGRRYLFVLQETEGWKVGIGLQRLRKSSQVRALGVTGMPASDSRTALGQLGYA